jgi:hypothetical protein
MKYVSWVLLGVFIGALLVLYLGHLDLLHIGYGTHTATMQ